MTSSQRNPKELRSLIQNCQSENFLDELEIFEEPFRNLRNIPNEDKTEFGMMKARVEEQGRLIMMLKKSGDDYLNKNSVMEKLNGQLNDKLEELENSYKTLEVKNNLINERFKTLSDYNEEIIKYKDEYKAKSVQLAAELADLKQKMNSSEEALKFAEMKTQMESKINELRQECEKHEKNSEKANQKFERIKANINRAHEDSLKLVNAEWASKVEAKEAEIMVLNSKVASKNSEFISFKLEIDEGTKEVSTLKSTLVSKENEYQMKVKDMEKQLEKQKSEFEARISTFSININQVTKEKLNLSSQCKKLTEENKFVTEKCSCLEARVEDLEQQLNSSSILEQKRKFKELQEEFESYKNYQSVLIEKEKEVNAKLRFLVS